MRVAPSKTPGTRRCSCIGTLVHPRPSCATTCELEGVRLYALAGLIGAGAVCSARSSRGRCGAMRPGKTCSPTRWACCCALALYAAVRPPLSVPRRDPAAALLIALGCARHLPRADQLAWRAPTCIATASSRCWRVSIRASSCPGSWAMASSATSTTACSTCEFVDGTVSRVFISRAGAGLAPFTRPWRSTSENPDEPVLNLGMRVHDIGHGREYIDRFNRKFELAPRRAPQSADSARRDPPCARGTA